MIEGRVARIKRCTGGDNPAMSLDIAAVSEG
jgi:hypothetical protein